MSAKWFTCFVCDSQDVYEEDKSHHIVFVNGTDIKMCYDCRVKLMVFLEIFRLGADFDLWDKIKIPEYPDTNDLQEDDK